MAKIEMDMTEYELMKDKERLLKESLEREQQLGKELITLRDETIKALEEAKMRVVKISKTYSTEHVLRKNNPKIAIEGIVRSYMKYGDLDKFRFDDLINSCFETITSNSERIDEITTHGLDDVKAELRVEIEKSVENELKSLRDFAVGRKGLEEKYAKACAEREEFREACKRMDDRLIDQDKKINELEEEIKDNKEIMTMDRHAFKKVSYLLKDNYSFFEGRKTLKAIEFVVNSLTKEKEVWKAQQQSQ